MPEQPCVPQLDELTEIIRRLFQLRHRLQVVLPEDMIRLKAKLAASHPSGKTGHAADFALLHNVGDILGRQPEPLTMGELGRALDVPLSTATRIVDWLVENDYAERLPDPNDRRVVRVALTDAGRHMYAAIDEFIRGRVARLLRHFTATECAQLVPLLRKLVETMEEEGASR